MMKPNRFLGFVFASLFIVPLVTAQIVPSSFSDGESNAGLSKLLTKIDSLRETGKVSRTGTFGGQNGGLFRDTPKEPAVLIGLNYTASRHYVGHLTIKAVQPIYLGREGEVLGQWHGQPSGKVQQIKAKDGFAVAGMIAKWGNRIDGLRLVFMEIIDGRLDPESTYRSQWIGGMRGSPKALCGVTGNPIIGIHGRQGNDLDAIGFIHVQQNYWMPKPNDRSLESLMPNLVGNWVVKYTNNTQHTRQIFASQRVNDGEEIVQEEDGDILIVFPEVIERVTVSGDRLLIEHFNPSSTYPNGTPSTMGVGKRAP